MSNFFKAGSLVRINNFQFEDGTVRDKYLIVLYRNDTEAFVIHTLTTSKNNLNLTVKQHGCNVENVNNRPIPYFFFPENYIIDTNSGFYFDVDTYVFFLNNIRKATIQELNRYDDGNLNLVLLAQLDNKELKRLLKCVLKSPFAPKDIKILLTDFKESL
jgi:hypothetical protein